MHEPHRQVDLFHQACGLRRPNYPCIDWQDMQNLRFDLMEEELMEYKAAVHNEDVLEMIDALCDLLYVTYGAAVAAGIDLQPFYDEVQRANMEKTLGPKREDGKQLKPEGWRGPDHEEVWLHTYGTYHYSDDTGREAHQSRSLRSIRSADHPPSGDEPTEA